MHWQSTCTHESPSARAWRRLLRRKSAVFGLVVIVLFVLMAVFAPLLTPYDPDPAELDLDPQAALVAALVRHR